MNRISELFTARDTKPLKARSGYMMAAQISGMILSTYCNMLFREHLSYQIRHYSENDALVFSAIRGFFEESGLDMVKDLKKALDEKTFLTSSERGYLDELYGYVGTGDEFGGYLRRCYDMLYKGETKLASGNTRYRVQWPMLISAIDSTDVFKGLDRDPYDLTFEVISGRLDHLRNNLRSSSWMVGEGSIRKYCGPLKFQASMMSGEDGIVVELLDETGRETEAGFLETMEGLANDPEIRASFGDYVLEEDKRGSMTKDEMDFRLSLAASVLKGTKVEGKGFTIRADRSAFLSGKKDQPALSGQDEEKEIIGRHIMAMLEELSMTKEAGSSRALYLVPSFHGDIIADSKTLRDYIIANTGSKEEAESIILHDCGGRFDLSNREYGADMIVGMLKNSISGIVADYSEPFPHRQASSPVSPNNRRIVQSTIRALIDSVDPYYREPITLAALCLIRLDGERTISEEFIRNLLEDLSTVSIYRKISRSGDEVEDICKGIVSDRFSIRRALVDCLCIFIYIEAKEVEEVVDLFSFVFHRIDKTRGFFEYVKDNSHILDTSPRPFVAEEHSIDEAEKYLRTDYSLRDVLFIALVKRPEDMRVDVVLKALFTEFIVHGVSLNGDPYKLASHVCDKIELMEHYDWDGTYMERFARIQDDIERILTNSSDDEACRISDNETMRLLRNVVSSEDVLWSKEEREYLRARAAQTEMPDRCHQRCDISHRALLICAEGSEGHPAASC